MPLGTLHTVKGVVRREPRKVFLAVSSGGEWELEPDRMVIRHVGQAVVIEGVRTGYNRLEVVRIKREGEEWPPDQSWTNWFSRWRKR
jgi:hypothetical protein